jgi:hypothetical protein
MSGNAIPNIPALLALVVPLGAPLALSGCIAVAVGAGVAAGYFIHEAAISDDTVEAEIQLPAETVFNATREEMQIVSTEPISVKASIREIDAKYDDANITSTVTAADTDRCYLRIKARNAAFPKLDTARHLLHRVQDRLKKIKK